MFAISFIIMLFVLGRGEQAIGTLGGALCMIQCVVLVASIFFPMLKAFPIKLPISQ
ncbi:hypothetical protein [Clostridium perfringens]|uniref:Uncharacterized protein n=1 Tax=Clostridium perfringens (strain SM101 / Type A) TaxID=289380 RepID=Q0SUK1_CLOPS|nr:hypothetical protein [Clostridium perfringens]ABG87327.1 hypothetical protein CPR_0882 [Clostridium perfringens SM101]MDH5061802.1 hypothetical protein [Clostridium perfringens NCTC 8239]CAG9340781.1 Uncharacterised protein [Clostridium perfringens NCTC 8239]SQB41198.1 Uncharacterised protein [Clostridium perfringens]STB55456.1 Uncharacterised protein [Clostridium perfringens]